MELNNKHNKKDEKAYYNKNENMKEKEKNTKKYIKL